VAKLPKDQRDILFMRYHEALSLEEMESRLKRTTAALYRLLSRVRHVLHGCVTQTLQSKDYERSV
jgi:RNA polymerase sigma-70 factor (ECF subfamily)